MKHLTDRILSLVDRPAFSAVRARYDYDDGPSGVTKFLDLGMWIAANVQRALALDLYGSFPRRILDIGAGCGYFAFVCRALGHEVIALDHPQRSPLFRDVCAVLGVDVIDHEIRPFDPLPDLGTFDAIAAFMVTFNGHMATPWDADGWRFFIADARSRLRSGGSIVLELNREPPPLDACYTPELRAAFVELGAEFAGYWPYEPTADGHRLIFKSTT